MKLSANPLCALSLYILCALSAFILCPATQADDLPADRAETGSGIHWFTNGMRFNALDTDDQHYAEYQFNLCQGVAEERDRFQADVFWLTQRDVKLTPATAEDYVLSQILYEKYGAEFDANCRR